MTDTVLEVKELINRDALANSITLMHQQWNDARREWIEEKKELRNYLFATDTTKTTNKQLPWKNKTTVPKITQIRDNLHANYMAALLPNDDWLTWRAGNEDAANIDKAQAVKAYMQTKIRESGMFSVVSRLVFDYIDYGNCFAQVTYEQDEVTTEDEQHIKRYVGPKLNRISPLDITFNPMAMSFRESPKIVRTIKTMGELEDQLTSSPDDAEANATILNTMKRVRSELSRFSPQDVDKGAGFTVDGFGSVVDYYSSNYVELLTFYGTIHSDKDGLLKNYKIVVADRSYIVDMKQLKNWTGSDNIVHAGWRLRPDNLYGMGPLDNLVGMQYRIDHLENIKADLFDLIAHPPLKIKGAVDDFEWGPFAEIRLGDSDDVEILKVDATALNADTQIAILEQRMEELAGAPKEAMGIRTPGEKTAFEVQSLQNAAGRIFQEKVTNFEIELLEPALNRMLEVARQRLDYEDLVSIMDTDLGVTEFMSVTQDDLVAQGTLVPMGARHFAQDAQIVQNLAGLTSSGIAQNPAVAVHISGKKLAQLMERLLGVERFGLYQENVGVIEAAETESIKQQAQQDLMSQLQQTSPEEDTLNAGIPTSPQLPQKG